MDKKSYWVLMHERFSHNFKVIITMINQAPLSGITVLSFEHAIAAPLCTRQLAELGARVIKVERREVGDFARHYDTRVKGQSSHFIWTNRSKQSLTLDIKHPEAKSILMKILEQSDVLVQNLAPSIRSTQSVKFVHIFPPCKQLDFFSRHFNA